MSCGRFTMTCYIYYNNVSHELECRNERSANWWHSPTKLVANIPPGIGIRFIVPVFLHNRKCVSTLLNTCIYFTEYVYSFHRHVFFRCQICVYSFSNLCFSVTESVHLFHHTHISVCHFVGVFVYAGAINRTPTAANGLPKCC